MASDVLVAGETLIDFIPERSGPLSAVEGFDRRPGGAPANVAVALAKLGRSPAFWTRLADDPFGRYLRGVLTDRGLPERFIRTDSTAQTTLAFVTHDGSGDRSFSFYREETADTRMEPGAITRETLSTFEWVHAGGVALSSGRSREATRRLLADATAAGCTVSFDPNFRPELWPADDFATVVGEVLENVGVLKATVEELRALGFDAETPIGVARAVLAAGPHAVFITRGAEGAVAVADEDSPWSGETTHGGFSVDVVDTTGAGDAFVAGAVAALVETRDLESALAFANAVAASATTGAGAMAALPDREAVETVLEAKAGDT